jgi:Reverse transcriptase (RNA-dependent DNA polymerase)
LLAVKWSAIQLAHILTIKYSWPTSHFDIGLAYPQPPVKCDFFMQILRAFRLFNEHKKRAMKLKRNLDEQRQAGRVWNQYLTKTLRENCFKQIYFDDSIFYFNDCLMLIYVDDTLIAVPILEKIESIVSTLSILFKVEHQGDMSVYLRLKIKQLNNRSFSLTQPHLIDSILKDLHFKPSNRPLDTPALSKIIL